MTTVQMKRSNSGLLIIAIFKLFKGGLLLILAIGVLGLLHRDVQRAVESWINLLRVDPNNQYVTSVLAKMGLVGDRQLKELGGLGAIYACLFLTEGIGLLLQKHWAEYLTVIATASFVPLEIYEIAKLCSVTRVLLLIGTLLIIWFLIRVLRKPHLK